MAESINSGLTTSNLILDAGEIGKDLVQAVNASEVLGLINAGGMAVQNPSSVAITGGTITGVNGLTRVLYSDAIGAGNAASSTTNVINYTLTGGTVGKNGDSIVFELCFSTAANANNKRVVITGAGRTLYDSTSQAVNAGVLILQLVWTRQSSATTFEVSVNPRSSDALWTSTPSRTSNTIASPASGWAADFSITVACTGTGANDVYMRQGQLIYRSAP